MSLTEGIHQRYVAPRRVRVLTRHLAELIRPNASVLDVGCGDGRLAAQLARARPDLSIEGVDRLVRPATAITVRPYDGDRLPYAAHSVDVILLLDTLHHTPDPFVLLTEAVRVARTSLIIKDHLCDTWLARPILRWMDRIGNARHGVALPYTYWTTRQWREALAALGTTIRLWRTELGLYPWPTRWLCERSLHVLAQVTVPPSRASNASGASDGGEASVR